MAKTEEALKCPQCGNHKEFTVWIPEWSPYTWDGENNTWAGRADAEPSGVTGSDYHIICTCGHEWNEEPWD